MSDVAVIAREGETKGVYIHWADRLDEALPVIIERDGVENALEVIMAHHWSNIKPDAHDRALGHTELIEGYGNAYTDLDEGLDPVCMPTERGRTFYINTDGTVRRG